MEVGRYNQDKKQYLNCVCVKRDVVRGNWCEALSISAAAEDNLKLPSSSPSTQFK